MSGLRRWATSMTIGLLGCPFEPPPDTDADASDEVGETTGSEPTEVINDGEGIGIIQPPRLKDGLDQAATYATVIGAPTETWEGTMNSGQLSILIDDGVDGVMVPTQMPSTIVEDTHAPQCDPEQRFAWDLLANRRLGTALTFYHQEAGDDFEDHQNSLMASASTAGEDSGRVMNYFGCYSCAIFPRPDGDLGSNLIGGEFGAAIAVGFFSEADFHPLGVEHLVVGAPKLEDDGRVFILDEQTFRAWNYPFPGSAAEGGLTGDRECPCASYYSVWGNDDCKPFTETLEGVFPHEEFGAALAVADFDCDGLDDLVVGAPGAWLPSMGPMIESAGAVYVYFAEPEINPAGAQEIRQGQFEVGGEPEPGDRFGTVLSVGNFNGMRRLSNDRSCFDLVVGTPDEDEGAGQIQIFEGSPSGFSFGGPILDLDDVFDSTADPGDRFGASAVGGDFNDDGFDDLVIGAPGDNLGGSVIIIPGSTNGLALELASRFSQGDGIEGSNELGDEFGHALSWIKFGLGTGTPHYALVVGTPGESPRTRSPKTSLWART